jgi:hypothetical protein
MTKKVFWTIRLAKMRGGIKVDFFRYLLIFLPVTRRSPTPNLTQAIRSLTLP